MPAPHVPNTGDAAVVLVCATDPAVTRGALDHGIRLFGPDQRYIADAPALHGTDVSAICAAVDELGGTALIVGLDADDRDRSTSAFTFRLVRRCPCPVIVVTVDKRQATSDRR